MTRFSRLAAIRFAWDEAGDVEEPELRTPQADIRFLLTEIDALRGALRKAKTELENKAVSYENGKPLPPDPLTDIDNALAVIDAALAAVVPVEKQPRRDDRTRTGGRMTNAVETHALHYEDGSAAVELDIEGNVSVNFYDANDGTEPVFSLEGSNFESLWAIYQKVLKDEVA